MQSYTGRSFASVGGFNRLPTRYTSGYPRPAIKAAARLPSLVRGLSEKDSATVQTQPSGLPVAQLFTASLTKTDTGLKL